MKIYQSTLFRRLLLVLPPLGSGGKLSKYPPIAHRINRGVVTNPALQKSFTKEEIALLDKIVTNAVFVKFNAYLRKPNWVMLLDEKRKENAELRNPYD
ncbi:MAG: hypothetical protein K2P92_03630 [Bdellovibrionaceae bacterium]|nr:hypothetical protein [Pseudobdellovibrionaceae bacterium]